MPRAPALSCCLPWSLCLWLWNPSKWHATSTTCTSGEEDEDLEIVDVPHELTNVPYRSEPNISPTESTDQHQHHHQHHHHYQQTDHLKGKEPSPPAQRQSAPPTSTSTSTSLRGVLAHDNNPYTAAARLSHWGPSPYPPPTRSPPAVPVGDPARVLAEQRRQLQQRLGHPPGRLQPPPRPL